MPDERGIAVVGALPIEQRLLRVAAEASRVELADHLVPSRAGVALVAMRSISMRSISSSRTNVSLHQKQIRRVDNFPHKTAQKLLPYGHRSPLASG